MIISLVGPLNVVATRGIGFERHVNLGSELEPVLLSQSTQPYQPPVRATTPLGHESLETTHVYVEADLATKERALEKLAPMPGMPARYRADDKLLAFLAAL